MKSPCNQKSQPIEPLNFLIGSDHFEYSPTKYHYGSTIENKYINMFKFFSGCITCDQLGYVYVEQWDFYLIVPESPLEGGDIMTTMMTRNCQKETENNKTTSYYFPGNVLIIHHFDIISRSDFAVFTYPFLMLC